MAHYSAPDITLWQGRTSSDKLYLHEAVQALDLNGHKIPSSPGYAILGYACDEGVRRNGGRVGAYEGPMSFRKAFAKYPNHLRKHTSLYDAGNVTCDDGDLEDTQEMLSERVSQLIGSDIFPIVVGGGHDIAYGHYSGIKKAVGTEKVGVINLDAHFDLRKASLPNSGTPFLQIASDCAAQDTPFHYLCLGIRKDANDRELFARAEELNVGVVMREVFEMSSFAEVKDIVEAFIQQVDHVYVTVDMDGFSSAYAPGVSAPSPMGFHPDVAFETLKIVKASGKFISLDLAEYNPTYDIDNHTARLAASLVHGVIS